MTHKDIFTKFMIEYDKANVTSSYPSLTEYEIATVLDKAYMALIAQKVTGNNVRRSPFEADVKSVSDLQPLVITVNLDLGDTNKDNAQFTRIKGYPYSDKDLGDDDLYTDRDETVKVAGGQLRTMPDNVRSVNLPDGFLYFVAAGVPVDMHRFAGWMNNETYETERNKTIKPIDNKQEDYADNKFKRFRFTTAKLVSHQIAEKFFATAYNIPWVKNPMCYLEANKLFIVVDPVVGIPNMYYVPGATGKLTVTYKPSGSDQTITESLSNGSFNDFVINKNELPIVKYNNEVVKASEWVSLTYIKMPHLFLIGDLWTNDSFSEPSKTAYTTEDIPQRDGETQAQYDARVLLETEKHKALWNFELNDVAAEELISLAISYALENVESPRLNAHLGMRGLES